MKYFEIIDKKVAVIFQLQWKIGNISDMFPQYSMLCGYIIKKFHRRRRIKNRGGGSPRGQR